MMILIQGGSGSGKSAYAEKLAMSLGGEKLPLYYLATMKIFDEEGKKKAERHKHLRAGKGFLTIEQPVRIDEAIQCIKEGAVVLLECMSNLTANEMFAEERKEWETVVWGILAGVDSLLQKANHLIIVTNNVFEDGSCYEDTTMQYINALGKINCELAAAADEVAEVTAGILVPIKSRKGIL